MPLVIGRITACDSIPGKDKLKEIAVDIGQQENVKIVTNAPNVTANMLTVIATLDTELEINGDVIVVKKQSVGGRVSFGLVCDSKMCNWRGGAEGIAVNLPDDGYAIGDPCPPAKPRTGGNIEPAEKSIAEKKAEEKALKKAAVKEKREAKKAAKMV